MEIMQGTESCYDYTTLCCGVFMGYLRDIHGVFMGYTYVSGMCRVYIGYVSGMCRKKRDAARFLFIFRAGKVSMCVNKVKLLKRFGLFDLSIYLHETLAKTYRPYLYTLVTQYRVFRKGVC